MSEQNEVTVMTPPTFSEKWHADRVLKRSKKKARKELQKKGYSHGEATKMVKVALNNMVTSNKPAKKSAGRGR